MLKTLMGKADNMQEGRSNVNQGVLRKNLKETLKTKNILTETKTDFDGFTTGQDTTQEKILELQIMSIETFKTKLKGEKGLQNEQNIQELCMSSIGGFFITELCGNFKNGGTIPKGVTFM